MSELIVQKVVALNNDSPADFCTNQGLIWRQIERALKLFQNFFTPFFNLSLDAELQWHSF